MHFFSHLCFVCRYTLVCCKLTTLISWFATYHFKTTHKCAFRKSIFVYWLKKRRVFVTYSYEDNSIRGQQKNWYDWWCEANTKQAGEKRHRFDYYDDLYAFLPQKITILNLIHVNNCSINIHFEMTPAIVLLWLLILIACLIIYLQFLI